MNQTNEQLFIGAWKLLSCKFEDADGMIQDYMGPNPTGILTYGPNGIMAAQLMRNDRSRFHTEDWVKATATEAKEAFNSYQAYFGRYELDMENHRVFHHVEGAIFPNWHLDKSTQTRYFEFDKDNRLVLSTQPIVVAGRETVFRLVWERLY